MRPEWEKGLRGRLYVLGRRIVPLSWRRALRRRFAPEKLLGIRKPAIDVPTYAFDPNEVPPGRPDVLLLPVVAWSYRRQRPQQLAEALARRGKRVFYGALAGPDEPREDTPVAPGVTLLPIGGVRREDPADRPLGGKALEEAFASLAAARDRYGLLEAVALLQSPFWAPLARLLRDRFGWKTVYDCLDEHAGFATNRPAVVTAAERELVAAADLVLATSEVLRERLGQAREEVRLLPNACDYELFAGLPDPSPSVAHLSVGYVGTVAEWFDAELFSALVRGRPGWRFHVVGGYEGDRPPELLEAQNVELHGEVPHRDLPSLRARFDVEIIPFRLTALTHAVDPVKLYEAAAAGRPVVATRMRALQPLADRGLARLADGAEDFGRAIEAAAVEASGRAGALRAFARENTWDARSEALAGWLEALYPLVSVIVVTRDGLHWMRLCLESLDRRTDWPRWELVVVDNGSTDGTREWLAEEAKRRGPSLRVVAFEENRGFAPAVNAGIAASRGELLCLLNNDTVLTRGWLSSLVRHLEADPGLGMVSASTNEIANEAKVDVGYGSLEGLESWARRYTSARAGLAEPMEMLAMFCVLIRRATFEAVGPLDERFTVGMFEDDDYSRRLRAAGQRLAVARDSFVHHFGRGTFRALPEEEYLRIHRENRARYESKWAAPPRARRQTASVAEIAEEAGRLGGAIVFPPSIGWDITLVQRPHHLARAFARAGWPVVFQLGEDRPRGPDGAAQVVEDRLYLHGGNLESVRGIPGRILWCFTYNVPPPDALGGASLVYDVIDHPDVFPYPRATLQRNHARGLREARAVFAVSRPLLEEARETRPDAAYLPNGVDWARFAAPPDPASIPERLASSRARGRPVAGFVGALARWVDADLITQLAAARPDWDFALVGEPLDDSFARLEASRFSNVLWLGPRPYSAIPSILSAFDAALIPFRTGPEGANASPIKLYEYLAAGIPVVATPIPECAAIPEVSIGRDARAFSDLLERARAARRSPDYGARARARAKENDWSHRARAALAALGLASEDEMRATIPAEGKPA
ncbi:MAG: glycosyltransferase [Thermoanaerobaculia bacterium]